MTEDKPPPSLDDLDARLSRARGQEAERRAAEDRQGIGFVFRIGVDLVAAVGVGAAIGWGLDEWLGTRPWLMVLFFVLGAAAGMLNVWRTMSGLGGGVGYKPAERGGQEDAGDDDGGTGNGGTGNGPGG